MQRAILALFLTVPAASFSAACGDDEHDHDHDHADAAVDAPAVDAATTQAVTIDFAAHVGGTAFACGQSYTGVGSAASTYVGADFRFFVHDVRLTGADGDVPVTLTASDWQTADGVALLDFEDQGTGCQMGSPATNTQVIGTAPVGTYTGLAFKLGVPFEKNHLDATNAAAPMNAPGMFWAWSSGYKFLKADGTVGGQGFNLHLGSTLCPGVGGETPPTGPCANPNVPEIVLTGFTLGTSTVVADVARVLTEEDVSVNAGGPPGCMSGLTDPECDTVFPKLGLPINQTPAGTQTLFSVE